MLKISSFDMNTYTPRNVCATRSLHHQ